MHYPLEDDDDVLVKNTNVHLNCRHIDSNIITSAIVSYLFSISFIIKINY